MKFFLSYPKIKRISRKERAHIKEKLLIIEQKPKSMNRSSNIYFLYASGLMVILIVRLLLIFLGSKRRPRVWNGPKGWDD